MKTFISLLEVNLFIYSFLAIADLVGFCSVFGILYFLLREKFPLQRLFQLWALLFSVDLLILQFFDFSPLPHLVPLIFTSNPFPDLAFHFGVTSNIMAFPPYSQVVAVPLHELSAIMPIILQVVSVMIVASYSLFVLRFGRWSYYFFVIGSALVATILNFEMQMSYFYLISIVLVICISIVLYEKASTVKRNLLTCTLLLVLTLTVSGILSEMNYQKIQNQIKGQTALAQQIASVPTMGDWETFTNEAGHYTVSYPSKLFYEDNQWHGGNADTITDFHFPHTSLPNTEYVRISIFTDRDYVLYKHNLETNGLQICSDLRCKKYPVHHKVITLNNIQADQYFWDDPRKETDVETLFIMNGKTLDIKLTYPKENPIWIELYNKVWSSIKL